MSADQKQTEVVSADRLLFEPFDLNGQGVFVTSKGSIVLLGFYGQEQLKTMHAAASAAGMRPLRLEDIAPTTEVEHVITPMAVQQTYDAQAPVCPYHQKVMVRSKKNSGYYCQAKNPDGSYCKHTVT